MSWHEFSGHFAVSAGRGLPGRLATLFDGRICTIFGDGIPHRRGYTRQLLHVQEVAPKHARCGTPVYRIAKGIPGNCLMYKKLRQGTHAMVHRYTASPMVYPITSSGITSCVQASTWKYTSIPFFGLSDARYTCNSFFLKGLFCKVYLIFYLVGKWMK